MRTSRASRRSSPGALGSDDVSVLTEPLRHAERILAGQGLRRPSASAFRRASRRAYRRIEERTGVDVRHLQGVLQLLTAIRVVTASRRSAVRPKLAQGADS